MFNNFFFIFKHLIDDMTLGRKQHCRIGQIWDSFTVLLQKPIKHRHHPPKHRYQEGTTKWNNIEAYRCFSTWPKIDSILLRSPEKH